jgi:hypothetical protein
LQPIEVVVLFDRAEDLDQLAILESGLCRLRPVVALH